jgi:uncharacterized protein involved in response to NO
MQFSTTIPQYQEKNSWWQRFISQPHQLFFSSALFFAIFIMLLTLCSLTGILNLDFSLIHGFGFNYALFTNAFLGFLITVIPKYNATQAINKDKYLNPWILYQIGIFITLFINITLGKILISFVLFYFVKLFYETIKRGKASVKTDSIYINFILFLGALMLLIEAVSSLNLSELIFFCFLISMVFIIALKMIPAFYFGYTGISPWQRPKYIPFISITLIFLTGISMQFELDLLLKTVSLLSSVFFGYVLFKLNLFKKTPAILSILVLGLVWFELAYISLFLESLFLNYTFKLSFHIFAIGFMTTLLIGFGSRVIRGHAVPAQTIQADKITKALFVFTQLVLLTRIFASISFIAESSFFTYLLNLSSIFWILLFVIWTLRYAKTLLRIK